MAQRDRVQTWQRRTAAATTTYDDWSKQYKTDILEKYYQGHQWHDSQEDETAKYVINLVFPTIEIELPNLLYYYPKATVTPRPPRADDQGTTLVARAALAEAVIQQLIEDPRLDFLGETTAALFESFFRYGIIEVGYSGDFIDNPNVGKPILKDGTPLEKDGTPLREPARVVQDERLYLKRIPAAQFRVSGNPDRRLDHQDWVGYYEWHYPEDLKRNTRYKNTSKLRTTGQLRHAPDDPSVMVADTPEAKGMVKVWKIWDLRGKVRHVFPDDGQTFFLENEAFAVLPFSALSFHQILDQWLPLPPVYNWLPPQDELNETREMQRVHRKRFYRRYTVQKGQMDDTELEKLETGGDGVYAKRNSKDDPIKPVEDAPLGSDLRAQGPLSKEDFIQISGVSSEQRQVADAETATQATIMDIRARIRESKGRRIVGDWLSDIIRTMLLTLRTHFTLPLAIEATVDPSGPNADEEALQVAQLWTQVDPENLRGFDFDVDVDVESLSPLTEDAERVAWTQVMTMMTNPNLIPLFASSPALLKKTMQMYNVTSAEELREIQKALQGMMQMLQQQQTQGAPGPQGPAQGTGGPEPLQILSNVVSQLEGNRPQ